MTVRLRSRERPSRARGRTRWVERGLRHVSRCLGAPSAVCVFGLLTLTCLAAGCRDRGRESTSADATRIVSLSPAVTETLFVLGLGPSVVAVSDYCHEPKAVERLDRVGTIFTPRYEALVAAHPSVILAEKIDGTNVRDLERLCKTETYRWLSYADVVASTRSLGARFGKTEAAERLIATYESAFAVARTPRGPRVLLVMPHAPGQLTEIWYIRRNSIHGRALEAAGAINAVAEDVVGPPRMGLERAILLDPDRIVILEPAERGNPVLMEDYRRLTGMRAVREGRVAMVAAPELEVPGPRIVRLVERLRRVLGDERAQNATPDAPAAPDAPDALGARDASVPGGRVPTQVDGSRAASPHAGAGP